MKNGQKYRTPEEKVNAFLHCHVLRRDSYDPILLQFARWLEETTEETKTHQEKPEKK